MALTPLTKMLWRWLCLLWFADGPWYFLKMITKITDGSRRTKSKVHAQKLIRLMQRSLNNAWTMLLSRFNNTCWIDNVDEYCSINSCSMLTENNIVVTMLLEHELTIVDEKSWLMVVNNDWTMVVEREQLWTLEWLLTTVVDRVQHNIATTLFIFARVPEWLLHHFQSKVIFERCYVLDHCSIVLTNFPLWTTVNYT